MCTCVRAAEATAALRPVLGRYYLTDARPVAVAMWASFRECYGLPAAAGPGGGVYFTHSGARTHSE